MSKKRNPETDFQTIKGGTQKNIFKIFKELLGILGRLIDELQLQEASGVEDDIRWRKLWKRTFSILHEYSNDIPVEILEGFIFDQLEARINQETKREEIYERILRYARDAPSGLLERFILKQHDHVRRVQRLDYEKAEIFIHVDSLPERGRLYPVKKEEFTVNWLESELRSGGVFFDVGANIGAYSLITAAIANGKARVFAFEPSYSNYAALCKNVVLNDLSGSVVCLPVALWSRTGLERFNYRDLRPGAALHSLGKRKTGKGQEPVAYLDVMVYRLDDIIKMLGLPVPTHIKVDVDGGELQVLEGASATLADPCLRSVMIEISITDSTVENRIREIFAQHRFVERKRHVKTSQDGKESLSYTLFAKEPLTAEL